jgi:cell division protein FtsN
MARDYKHRAHPRKQKGQQPVAIWRWLLIVFLVVGFGFFLFSLDDVEPKKKQVQVTKKIPKKSVVAAKPTKPEKSKTEGPRFDFYTILPEKEVVVGDYEVKTRKQEKKIGKVKAGKYLLQAGSFKNYKQADSLRAKLALMGIESRIEKANIGNVTWNRIKIGPFSSMTAVDRLRKRLRQNKIDTVVTEISG